MDGETGVRRRVFRAPDDDFRPSGVCAANVAGTMLHLVP